MQTLAQLQAALANAKSQMLLCSTNIRGAHDEPNPMVGSPLWNLYKAAGGWQAYINQQQALLNSWTASANSLQAQITAMLSQTHQKPSGGGNALNFSGSGAAARKKAGFISDMYHNYFNSDEEGFEFGGGHGGHGGGYRGPYQGIGLYGPGVLMCENDANGNVTCGPGLWI